MESARSTREEADAEVSDIDCFVELAVYSEFIGYQIPVCTLGETTNEMEKAFYKKQKEKPGFVEAKGAGYKDVILRLSISGGKKSVKV